MAQTAWASGGHQTEGEEHRTGARRTEDGSRAHHPLHCLAAAEAAGAAHPELEHRSTVAVQIDSAEQAAEAGIGEEPLRR